MPKQFAITDPSIGREENGQLFYAGPANIQASFAVALCNIYAMTGKVPPETAMAIVESLPMLDEKVVMDSDLMLV